MLLKYKFFLAYFVCRFYFCKPLTVSVNFAKFFCVVSAMYSIYIAFPINHILLFGMHLKL